MRSLYNMRSLYIFGLIWSALCAIMEYGFIVGHYSPLALHYFAFSFQMATAGYFIALLSL